MKRSQKHFEDDGRERRNVAGWPVMKHKCQTCPFGPNGDKAVAAGVTARTIGFQVSQICHHPSLHGRPETHLCRGARDQQLVLLHRIGMIDSATDEAFAKRTVELGLIPPAK